ncbi:hypothetical protein VTO42DRAFT_8659 [Malbranchea cinnamomea]
MTSEHQDNSAAMAAQQQQPAQQQPTQVQQQPVQQQTPQQQAPQQLQPQAQQQPVAQQSAQDQQPQAPAEQPQQQQGQHATATQVASPHVPVQQPVAPANTQQAAVAAAAAAVSVPVNLAQNASSASTSPAVPPESLICQWQGCQEKLPTPEALYEHICERHVGRKSTNNLNLTCQWANCRTTTVKRDHITSHIRVHVPLKPHKCDFCGKAFKRPQDLKKHVKTHADDSVLVRSPDPAAGPRPPNGMYNVAVGPEPKPTHYFEGSMAPVPGAPYGHPPPPHYYQPHPQHQPNPSYGNVYYSIGNDATHQAAYESKKRGYDALNEFFGDLKRRQFDPTSYAAVGQRLLGLHGLSLPLVNSGPTPEYQPAPAMVSVGGHGGYGPAPAPLQPYHLPPMGNLRTKADVMQIDQFLEQMQATVFENEEHVAASGVGQPGAHYVQGNMSYRTTNSPPTATQLPSSHSTATTSAPTVRSPPNSTPALTPPSSAQSYTSGRSPIHHTHQGQPSMGMYPTLPATTAQEHPTSGYASVSGAAPPSTLSSMFDNDDRRRYGGGMLQKARLYSSSEAMDHSANDERRISIGSAASPKFPDSLVDPALRRASEDHQHASKQSSNSPTPAPEHPRLSDPVWVEHVRILSEIRKYVQAVLADMEAREQNHAAQHQASTRVSSENQQTQQRAEIDEDNLYPVLKMHLDAENERERMKMDES